MTLPQNVEDALSRVQMMADSESEWADIDIADWHTIRAHLMSQEAEIARLREENIKLHGWFNAEAQASGNMQYRLNKYESHLAAANALLRFVSRYLDPRHYTEVIRRIDAHLQGAGDEA